MSNLLKITVKTWWKAWKGVHRDLLKVPQRRPQVQQVSSTKEEAFGWEEQEETYNQKFSHLHQAQPEEQKQKHLLCDQEENQWQGGCSQGWEARKELESLHLGSQGCHNQYEGASNGVSSKGDLKPRKASGDLEA